MNAIHRAHTHPASDMRSLDQNARLHKLIAQLGLVKEAKADLMHQFTTGRTTSSADMTRVECANLIAHLALLVKTTDSDREFVMRRKLFHLAHLLDWEHADGQVDQERLLAWIEKYGVVKKHWNKCSRRELAQLVSQLDNVQKNWKQHG